MPGLIRVVQHSGYWELKGAADALAVYKDPRANAALRKALDRPNEEHYRRSVVEALVACGGLTPEQIASAVERYAALRSTERGRKEIEKAFESLPKTHLDGEVSLGLHLSGHSPCNEAAAVRLLARAEALEDRKPEVARSIRDLLKEWRCKPVHESLARRLTVDIGAAAAALSRREDFLKDVEPLLRDAAGAGALPSGFAAVLLGDSELAKKILAGTDHDAQRGLLAAARLIRHPLSVDGVAALLKSGNDKLALACERYLEAEDSAAARKLVLERHPGEARILGARMGFDPGHETFGEFTAWEKRLREEIRAEDAPDEIIALLSAGYWGSTGQRIVRIRGNRAEITLYEKDKPEVRTLDDAEVRNLKDFLKDERIDDLPPLSQVVFDGMQFEYVRLRKEGGRRVFMNNPGTGGSKGSPYDRLTRHLMTLAPGRR